MLIHAFADRLTGKNKAAWNEGRIRGTVVLVKKEALIFDHFTASVLDGIHQFLGQDTGLAFQLVSATNADPRSKLLLPRALISVAGSFPPGHSSAAVQLDLRAELLLDLTAIDRMHACIQARRARAKSGSRRTWRRW